MTQVDFDVAGEPAAQGSKVRTPHGGLRESNRNVAPWRNAVAAAAAEAMRGRPPLTGPLGLYAAFSFARPNHHYGTGRNAGQLKPGAPHLHALRPDLDKLLRAVCDALTGIAYVDDAQLAELEAVKGYGSPGLSATVYQLER